MYILYYCYKLVTLLREKEQREKEQHDLPERLDTNLEFFNRKMKENLASIFNTRQELLKDAKFITGFSEQELEHMIRSTCDVFLMPAEGLTYLFQLRFRLDPL